MKVKENVYTCGTCKYYESDLHYCRIWSEANEQNTCDGWTDDNEVEQTEDEKRANAGCDEAHRIMVEGRER